MANPRFYYPATSLQPLTLGAAIELPPAAVIHASRALRMQAGDAARLFNGDGHDYQGELLGVQKNNVVIKITDIIPVHNESPLSITLVQAISSGDRMDFTIQKAVEMGVTSIQPVSSQRSVVKLSGERAEKRREHWQNVVISACEQSGRAVVPAVAAPLPLATWLGQAPAHAMRLTLSPTATQSLHDLQRPVGEVCLLIGCEGGLTDDEVGLAAGQGFIPVQLGKRVLRTETAALATIAALQALWGDY